MNKKKIIILIVLVALISIGCIVCRSYIAKEKLGYYDFEKSNFKETIVNDNKIIEEKKLGLKMTIPKDWESDNEQGMGILLLRDPKINVESPLKDFKDWTQGCVIGMFVSSDKNLNGESSFDEDNNRIKHFEDRDCLFDSCSIMKVNNISALKEIKEVKFEEFNIELQHVFIEIPNIKKRRIYKVEALLSSQVPECQEHLDNFLNSLEIN